jgi:mannose-6-phosphate isomerase-like protein (cupin superfamily)
MAERMTVQKALQQVRNSADGRYAVLLENGSMELGYYKPVGRDTQTPHEQDEIYIVQSGNGTFIRDGEEIPVAPGDALFVAAGVVHRFVNFSDDFGCWVIFWGPPGGEPQS